MSKMYTTEELSVLLHTPKKRIQWYRKYGLLKYKQIGRHRISYQEDVDKLIEIIANNDISNERKIAALGARLKKLS